MADRHNFPETAALRILDLVSRPPSESLSEATAGLLPLGFDRERVVVSDQSDDSETEDPTARTWIAGENVFEQLHPAASSTAQDVSGARSRKILALTPEPESRWQLLKKFDGFVTAVFDDSFVARFFERSDDHPVMEAEIGFDELSEADRQRVTEGARLVWTISYRNAGGTRKRESSIYFRRLPPMSEEEMKRHEQAARELVDAIVWE